MPLPSSLQYLDPLLDVLVEMAIEDVRKGTNENGAESGQEQRRRGDQADATLPEIDGDAG